MLNLENLEKFTKSSQTSLENVVREYCQHLFLSFLYQQPGSEKLLFKGGTALRIVFRSPRYSEDLDFTGLNIREPEVEEIFTNTLADIEKTGIKVVLNEGKPTTGGYLGIATFGAYGRKIPIQVEVSLRNGKGLKGIRALIGNDYIPAYTLVHLSEEGIVGGKMRALLARRKPRDFYDYFFFRNELRQFLPATTAMHLKDFRKILTDKIKTYIG